MNFHAGFRDKIIAMKPVSGGGNRLLNSGALLIRADLIMNERGD